MKHEKELHVDSVFHTDFSEEEVSRYKGKLVKCRKPHICQSCQKEISVGKYAIRKTSKPVSCYTCISCIETWVRRKSKRRMKMNEEKFVVNTDLFGSYAKIPTGFSKSEDIYKVISLFQSNSYCDIPLGTIQTKEILHKNMVDVINVIHCGIDETEVVRVALKDCTIVNSQPTADAKEVVRGEWMEHTKNGALCSNCGMYSSFTYPEQSYPFCPHCTADMRGEKDG